MPTFNQSQNGKWFVTHGFVSKGEAVTRNYNLSEDGVDFLLKKGFRNGQKFPIELFHRIRIEGDIFIGQPPLHAPRDIDTQRKLTQKISVFFEIFDSGEIQSSGACRLLKDEILTIVRNQPRELRDAMILDIADKIQTRIENSNELNALNQMSVAILDFMPTSLERQIRAIFGAGLHQ
jgi:hypothetical protein